MSTRYFIRLAFDGTRYHGWQIQQNAPTIQQEISAALSIILKTPTEITGCGRTDTGVHANEFFAHFNSPHPLPDAPKTSYQLNALLPDDIFIDFIRPVDQALHARFSALRRTYKYYINFNRNPFNKLYAYTLHPLPDIHRMNAACPIMMQHTDFSCFSKSHTQVNNNNCTIYEAHWTQTDQQLIFTITANRFLRNMVRAIVGTMIELGNGKMDLQGFIKVLESNNRSLAGTSVPAKGLFLYNILYPEGSF